MEIKTLLQIKDEVARKHYYESYKMFEDDLTWRVSGQINIAAIKMIDEVAKIYASQFIELAAERAQLDLGEERGKEDQYLATDDLLHEFGITVDKQSILSIKDIINKK